MSKTRDIDQHEPVITTTLPGGLPETDKLPEVWESASPQDRAILILAMWGMKKTEIASAVGTTRDAVYRTLNRLAPGGGEWKHVRDVLHRLRIAQWETMAMRAIMNMTDEKLAKASPKELAIVAGIAEDKAKVLKEKLPPDDGPKVDALSLFSAKNSDGHVPVPYTRPDSSVSMIVDPSEQ